MVPDSTPCDDTDDNICTVAGCDAAGSCDQNHMPAPVAECQHYKCYKTRGRFTQRTVTLLDQFKTTTASVKAFERLCNPANKNGEGLTDPTAHLMCYRIKEERFQKRDVIVENQFGVQALTVKRPESLCVPAEKDGVASNLNINHFKCYTATEARGTPDFEEIAVDLEDQFERKVTRVKRPRLLCNPVDKNGEDVEHPEAHFVCYNIKDERGQPRFQSRNVKIADQFTTEELPAVRGDCSRVSFLCVPSTKRLASPSGAFLDIEASLLE